MNSGVMIKQKKIIVSEPWSWLNIKFTISLIQSRTAISLLVTVQFFLRPSIYENFTLKIQSADEKNNEKKFPRAVNEDKMDRQIRQTDNRKKQTKKQQNKIEPTWYK